MSDDNGKQRKSNLKTLRPRKHHQIDFFLADEVAISSVRDEIASMEHPFFALKPGDAKVREYKNGNVSLTVRPAVDIGLATIFDKDIWIYAISKLQNAINNNKPISRTIAFTPYDFFVTSNRDKGGRSYKELENSLNRLKGTTVTTNIKHSEEKQETTGFGLIDSWRILEGKKGRLDIGMVEIVLPNWLFEAISQTKILKISPDYFRIRKAVDRRIYEIARKHCGNQYEFEISLEKLHLKMGSSRDLRKFRFDLKQLTKLNDLPDYEIFFVSERDSVLFRNRNVEDEKVQQSKNAKDVKQKVFHLKRKLLR